MRAEEVWSGISTSPQPLADSLKSWGKMGRAVLACDWSRTPLGPISGWDHSLKSTVRLMLGSAQPMGLWYGPELTTIFNDGFIPILGKRADTALGRPFEEVWHDIFDDVLPMVRRALSGETVWMENLPLLMTRNGFEEETFWTFSYSPVFDDSGRVAGFLDVVTEMTETVKNQAAVARINTSLQSELEANLAAEEQQKLLRHELVHRIKNMLIVARILVSQTILNSSGLEEANRTVIARLDAFARAQDVFNTDNWQRAQLSDVVEAALAPHPRERVQAEGPAVQINAQQSFAIALLLHELATNAAKYGALSRESGRVRLKWNADPSAFELSWSESGGPVAERKTGGGFGTTLIERIVPDYFSGTGTTAYKADGIAYILRGRLESGGAG